MQRIAHSNGSRERRNAGIAPPGVEGDVHRRETMDAGRAAQSNHDPLPLISVVVPTYNRGRLLLETIHSVLAQSYRDYELIVVDDGSEDETESLLAPYRSRLRLVRQANAGVASARNLGWRHSQGQLICFLDSDDLWLPRKLEKQVAFAQAHPQYGLIATEIAPFDADGPRPERCRRNMYPIRNGYVLEQLLFSNWLQTSTVMIRREALERAGGFDEDVGSFGEDWLLWMKIAAQYPVYFLPEPLVAYRVHAESLTLHQPQAQFESLMQILERLAELPQFEGKQHLIEEARWRVCVGRAGSDLAAQQYAAAFDKLHRAMRIKPFSLKTLALWIRTRLQSLGNSQVQEHS
jgi:Glycosyl transferase family 2